MKRIASSDLRLGLLFSLTFIVLLSLFFDFVLDDSFITYRYAENFAHGEGIRWNVGEDPVEGFTSFLWVALNALAILLRFDPVIFSKLLSGIAGLAIIWMLLATKSNLDWRLKYIFVASIALSPPFTFILIQGMETALTTFLLFLSALLSVKILRYSDKRYVFLWYCIAILGFLARPDSITFNTGILAGLIILFVINKNTSMIKTIIAYGAIFLVIGALYNVWRVSYFGYTFPNTFYVKFSSSNYIFTLQGIYYLFTFVIKIMLPYLLLCAFLIYKNFNKEKFSITIPMLTGFSFYCIYLMTIYPVQGFLWRFAFPVYPAFILAALLLFSEVKLSAFPLLKKLPVVMAILIVFTIWPLRLLNFAMLQKEGRTQHDRVMMGKSLAGIDGTMFVSESGALPFYSKWKAADLLGLNSEEIVHNGLSEQILLSLNPDLVMMLFHGPYKEEPEYEDNFILNKYMIENNFVAVAVVRRYTNSFHFYFVRRNSELFDEIAERLLSVDNIEYANMHEFLEEHRIPIYDFEPREAIN